ncbi:short chain dehydrogenase reductase [Grosmannia clavigera kw1407]|uniref:Short chain dehydrogenase reductase n=1 Tax=Grosmannia clavigera (strain kw1407 / UAMH 11150) TaxID=655863 RepID=F0X8H9_GROCL|nr:short chain dehydrogenase reductase [Grosmannia clavigera kw1407]EFX05528.1 short chain dehydrogenase reductase [Grosmannia clavigera kw1407]
MVLAAHPNPDAPVLTQFSLAGKTALVTGGSRGIGLEVAKGLAEAGAIVAITYSTSEPQAAIAAIQTAAAAASSSSASVTPRAYKCDVTEQAAIEAAVEAAARELGTGRLDILVANAGISDHTTAISYPVDAMRRIFDVNVNGAFWAAQASARVFQRQVAAGGRPGTIIFTASVSASITNTPQPQAAYNATKAALVHLAKGVAVEWVDFARVNCVSPGYIETDMIATVREDWRKEWIRQIPGRRMCQTAELKGIYLFLASDASSYMTGADLIIDGGISLP